MPDVSTEEFARRLYNCSLLDARQLDMLYGELGSRDVPLEQFQSLLVRRELLTNWQIDRVAEGYVNGFFYGHYKVLYLVGAGTFARVYRAVHRESGQVRAVKVLRQRYASDIETTEQFLREAKTVIPLRHPNICPIHEVDSERGRYYMVMDFIEGQNLRDFVRIHKALKLENALAIGRDIAAGLDYAFQRGITHRDLKLSNVLLASRGRALIVDFGLAAAHAISTDKSDDGYNSPRSIDYAGLERATGVKRDDKRSDIFFLGGMLYHMVSGQPPLSETRERIQRLSVSRYKDIPPVTAFVPNLPLRVVSIISKSMSLDPGDRFQTPGEMYKELSATLSAVEAGETDRYEGGLDDQQAYLAKKKKEKEREGESFTIMLVESSIKIQNALRDRLKKLGYKVLIISDPQRALQRFQNRFTDAEEEYPADCVVFGAGELGFDALDAFNEFGEDEHCRDVPAILITNDKQEAIVKEAKFSDHRVNVRMPVKFRQLRATLKKLVSQYSPNQSSG